MRCKLSKNQPTGLCFLLFAMIQTWTYLYSSKESLQRWRIQTYQQNILFFNLLMWRLAILQTSWKRVTVDERRRQNEKFKQTVAVTTASPRRTSRAVVTSSPISKQTNFLFSPRAQDASRDSRKQRVLTGCFPRAGQAGIASPPMSPIRAARSVPDLYQASESFERGFGGWCCHGYRGFGQINTTAQFGFVRVTCQQRQSSS